MSLTARYSTRRVIGKRVLSVICVCFVVLAAAGPIPLFAQQDANSHFVDLSLLVSPDRPCTWPQIFPWFQINAYRRIGPLSAYNSEILVIDPNTGTQLDVPPHSVPPPDSKLPHAAAAGSMTPEKVPAWQFSGEACVIDCRDLLEAAPKGHSALIKRKRVMDWEKDNRPLRAGDVVLFHSSYSDRFYRPFPAGRRFIADPVEGVAPGWPDPDPECMEYLAGRGVLMVGTDSPSMGPIPDLAEPTHYAGLRHGMIFTEGATGLGGLPTTGAFYCMMVPKHVGGAGSEGRAFSCVGEPLASRLIESARQKRVVDLSVVLSEDLPVAWPGHGVGRHRQPYFRIKFGFNPNVESAFDTHMMDSNTGTHLVPPSYALPSKETPKPDYDPQVQGWLAEYENRYGPFGTSDVTVENVPLSQTCGRARVIDVHGLVGSTDEKSWPASPEITVEDIQRFEGEHGPLNAGEIVIFHSGHSDRFYKPLPEGSACMLDPINGLREGWPAPGPDAIHYLASRGVRCVATDAPSLGGVEEKQALMTYWALGSKGMVSVEFLTNVGKLPKEAYFLFAPVKIAGAHGGPGRALAFF